MTDLTKLSEQYNSEKEVYLKEQYNLSDPNYTLALLNYIADSDEEKKKKMTYLEKEGFDFDMFAEIFTMNNLVLLMAFVLIIVISSFYLSCASYALIALSIKNKRLTFSNTIHLTNKFLLRLLSLRVLLLIIVSTPITIAILLVISLFFINLLLGSISVFFFVIFVITYLIFIGLRLFFATPIMFMEDKSAIGSIKNSYHLTKHHLKQVLVVFAVIYAISIFINSFVSSPLHNTFIELALTYSILKFLVLFIVVTFLLVLEALVLSFEHLFLFYAYIDFKEVLK